MVTFFQNKLGWHSLIPLQVFCYVLFHSYLKLKNSLHVQLCSVPICWPKDNFGCQFSRAVNFFFSYMVSYFINSVLNFVWMVSWQILGILLCLPSYGGHCKHILPLMSSGAMPRDFMCVVVIFPLFCTWAPAPAHYIRWLA